MPNLLCGVKDAVWKGMGGIHLYRRILRGIFREVAFLCHPKNDVGEESA